MSAFTDPNQPPPAELKTAAPHASRWTNYYKGIAGRSPRPEFLDALDHVPAALPRTAIDLGAGDGVETRHLLEQGWSVHAIDLTPGLRERVVALLSGDPGGVLTTLDGAFADVIALPPASFVYAGSSLPLRNPPRSSTYWRWSQHRWNLAECLPGTSSVRTTRGPREPT